MPRTDMPDKETPDRESIKSGDLVFILNVRGDIVTGKVSSSCPDYAMIRYTVHKWWGDTVAVECIPYDSIAFRGVYGGMVMGEVVRRRILHKREDQNNENWDDYRKRFRQS